VVIRPFDRVGIQGGPVGTCRGRISPYIDPETRDMVLSFNQSCSTEYKEPENNDPQVEGPFGCIGSLCTPSVPAKEELP